MMFIDNLLLVIIDFIIFLRKKCVFYNETNIPIKKNKIGLVRLGGGIGDFITLIPTLNLLRNAFPQNNNKIFIFIDKQWSGIAKIILDIDEVIPIDIKKFKSNIFYRLKILHHASTLELNTILDFALFRKLSRGDIIVKASRAKNRIGFYPQSDQIPEITIGNKFFTHLVNDCKWQIHEIERNTLLLSELQGFSNKLYQLPKIEITQNSIKKKQFIVAPGASRIGRQWPPEYFAKTSEYIFNRTGWIPIVVGTKDEEGIINKIITTSKDMPWKALHGNILIEDLFVLIANSFFLLCNDSGPMHIGPAVGTTTVAIVPGGEFNAYPLYPISSRYLNIVHVEDTSCFNCRWNCKYNWPKGMPAPCLSNISLQLALSKVESALDQMMTPYVA